MSSSNAFFEKVIFFFFFFFFFFFHWRLDDIDVESAYKYVAGKYRILTTMNISGSRVIHSVIVLCLPLSVGLTFIVLLKIISKLKAGSVPNVKVVSTNADTILVAINKRCNTNINEGN